MISLNIAIPTYERYSLLSECLESIREALKHSPKELSVKVFIFDNSLSKPSETLLNYISELSWCNYQKNEGNIGSDRNILKCLSLKKSQYIMVLGDDDRIVSDGLSYISKLLSHQPDILVLRAFGFSKDYLKEQPYSSKSIKYKTFTSNEKEKFLSDSTPAHTFISTQIFSTSLFREDELTKFLDTNLVQVAAFAISVSRGRRFAIGSNNVIAGMRENSGGYNSKEVFIDKFDIVWSGFCKGYKLCNSVFNSMIIHHLPAQFLRASNETKLDFLNFKDYPESYKKAKFFIFFKLIASSPSAIYRPIFLLWIIAAKARRGDFGFVFRYIYHRYIK